MEIICYLYIGLLLPEIYFWGLVCEGYRRKLSGNYIRSVSWAPAKIQDEKMNHFTTNIKGFYNYYSGPSTQTELKFFQSNRDISPIWLISPCLPVSAYNLPVFDKFSSAVGQNSSFQRFYNILNCFVFFNCSLKELPFKVVLLCEL